MECKGYNGSVEFDGTFVTIKRSGALGRLTVGKGDKRIPVSQIVAVQWKEPGPLVNGYISFTITGGMENRRGFGKQTTNAAKDENAVILRQKHADEFRQLRSEIEAAIAASHQPAPMMAAAPVSMADELAKLAKLRESGLLTDAEFEAQKTKLLQS